MADRKRQDSVDKGDEFVAPDDAASTVGSVVENPTADCESDGSGNTSGFASRLSEVLLANGDGDLLLQQSDRDISFLQSLQAFDLQVMGACRADERLKPLLKVNTSSCVAEDRLLAYLNQHFEAFEVGILARCLCVPLVSVRVGKVVKQGTFLCPTPLRGILNLILLPSSDLCMSFVGDDGYTQVLATLSHLSESSDVAVEEIPADKSGRSFQVKLRGEETFYFWCADKSRFLGRELLSKMKDLIKTKPTLSGLTGICESRLECFATHLRAYLDGLSVNSQPSAATSSAPWVHMRPDTVELLGLNAQPLSTSERPLRSRNSGGQALRGHAQNQGSLSPKSSSFKECLPKTLSSLKIASRESLRRRGDRHLCTSSSFMADAIFNLPAKGVHLEPSGSSLTSPLSFLESLGNCNFLPPSGTSQFPPINSLSSPFYCWCPPHTSPTREQTPLLPTPAAEPLSFPPLSSLLPVAGPPSLLSQLPPLDGGTPLELPALLSDPLTRLPFSNEGSLQIPTFTPLMCDSIVHIPVLDVCSSGQGYLVSAGHAIATSIPPLHPKLVGPMMSESESLMDKGARETLRLLIGSSGNQTSASLVDVLPAVLNEGKLGVAVTGSRGLYTRTSDAAVVVTGSRGLYTGTSDADAINNSFASVGLGTFEISQKVSSLIVCGSTTAPDALVQPSGGLDLEDFTFMSGEEKKDC